jgi:hypothetical protein
MGSYFKIDGREINSKHLSGLIIDHIRSVDECIVTEERLPDSFRKLLDPEYRNENGMGCGDWYIHRKGLALVILRMWETYRDDVLVRRFALEDWSEYGQKYAKENGNFDEALKEKKEDIKRDLIWCIEYLTRILADMVLGKMKYVHGEWV